MKKSLYIVLALVLAVLFTGCAGATAMRDTAVSAPQAMDPGDKNYYVGSSTADGAMTEEYAMEEPAPDMEMEVTTQGIVGEYAPSQRKIIYNGYMELVAQDPLAALSALEIKAKELGGYVTSSYHHVNNDGDCTNASLVLRMPSGTMDEIVQGAGEYGRVRSYNKDSEDITDAYYDLEGRIAQQELAVAEYEKMMEMAQSVEEILMVKEHLDRAQSELESMKGTMKRWNDQVDYSTLSIDITKQSKAADTSPEFIQMISGSDIIKNIKVGFVNMGRGVVNVLGYIVIGISYLIIPAVIIGVIVLVIVLAVKAKRRKKLSAAQQPEQQE